MLELLRIKNVALINELEIGFTVGLNVLSGETGAGKSIIIDALSFVLGERAPKDFIKTGTDSAQVDALFTVASQDTMATLEELGVTADDDGALFISRQINTDGKSTARVNGRVITSGLLKTLSAELVDIHSQHQHHSLLDSSRHITLLDRFCGGELPGLLTALGEAYKCFRDTKRIMGEISQSPEETAAAIQMYEFQVEEIESANLRLGEDDELLERRRLLSDAEKLYDAANRILEFLCDDDGSALDQLSSAQGLMSGLRDYDSRLDKMAGVLDGAYADLDDMAREFRRFAEDLPQGSQELETVEERISELYRLKRKYGRTIQDILSFCENAKEKLYNLHNSGRELERLTNLLTEQRARGLALCGRVTTVRKEAAARIKREIQDVLRDLGMKNAIFDIEITEKEDFNADGADAVEFVISPNPGEPLKPLAKIASGGEMSRVMLALKSTLAGFDNIGTFVFDEIDTGVSGRTAQMTAEKMSRLGESHQILCVTHLPQIAAMGDSNKLIEKSVVDGETNVFVHDLDRDGVTKELARLIGGAEITNATIKAADEMRRLAEGIKQKKL